MKRNDHEHVFSLLTVEAGEQHVDSASRPLPRHQVRRGAVGARPDVEAAQGFDDGVQHLHLTGGTGVECAFQVLSFKFVKLRVILLSIDNVKGSARSPFTFE